MSNKLAEFPRLVTRFPLLGHGRRLEVYDTFHEIDLLLVELASDPLFAPLRPETASDVILGDRLRLDGYDLPSQAVAAGETVRLRLHRRALLPVERDYTAERSNSTEFRVEAGGGARPTTSFSDFRLRTVDFRPVWPF